MTRKVIILIPTTMLILVLCLFQITIFVIQPIGAVPEGKTLVILRMNKTKLIDSADALCAREMGSVNLLCRGIIMAAIAEQGTILVKLPYSELLYSFSMDEKSYGG